MKVVIAEKPQSGRVIASVLGANTNKDGYCEGNGYQVVWAFGHLVEIYNAEAEGKWNTERLPILSNFTLQPKKDVGKQIKTIQRLIEGADEIINATDAGREGELIFRYLYHYLKCNKPFRRLWISSLTDAAIKEGFANLKASKDYDSMFDAARARSEADFYVGINATRALTLSIDNNELFSLGRVQTPTMAIVCRRYLENKNFVPSPFWTLRVKTAKDGVNFVARRKESYADKAQAEADFARLSEEKTLLVSSVETKEKQENPPLLYDLTGLQKAASRKHSMTPDKVLEIAQSLYESKYLSYPRTGSCYISDDVFETIPDLIAACRKIDAPGINATYYQNNPPLSKGCVNAAKVTDHHALLPTGKLPDMESLTKPEATIYLMVVGRMFEAFHKRCVKDITSVRLIAGDMELTTLGTVVREAGWREVLQKEVKEVDTEEAVAEEEGNLPKLAQGDTLPNLGAELKEDKTKPRPLLTDDTLLAYMETAGSEVEDEEAREAMKAGGLGTPATRHVIIKNIIDKQYVTREKRKLIPTSKGLATYEIIKDKLIGSPALTGEWEKKMSDIQAGTVEVEQFMAEVKTYTRSITAELLEVNASVKSQREEKAEAMPICPKCKAARLRMIKGVSKESGKSYDFMGCSDRACGFSVRRELAGKKLSDAQLIALATKGKTPPIKGFKSKTGKEFTASLMIDKDFKVVFPPKK